MKLSAVIVDDEEPARKLIREYLASFPEIELMAECDSGESAVEAINRLKPDLVFLDIQMPGWSGLDVLERLDAVPMVIFCTAYEKYAVQAFEVSAVDYLLKPYDRTRFGLAVEHAKERGSPPDEVAARLMRLLEAMRKGRAYGKRLFVKQRGKVVPVETSSIEWIEAQGDYAQLHTTQGSYLASETIKKLEALLDPAEFVRIHRSSLVNLDHIKQLKHTGTGSLEVELKSGAVLPVSRKRAADLRKWMV